MEPVEDPYWPDGNSMLLIVTLLGVVIGARAPKMNWATHGALLGALSGVFMAIRVVGEGIGIIRNQVVERAK